MKTIRKDWPKVRQYVKGGNIYFQVDLRRKHYRGQKWKNFTSRDEAVKYAAGIGDKIAKQGLNSLTVVTEDARIKAWAEQCASYGKTIEDAITVALGVFEKQRKVKESPYMGELLTLWVDDKVTNELKPLRPKTIKSIRNMAEMFKDDFGMARMKEIDSDRIERYLRDKDVSNQTRKNLLSYLGQFFNWAVSKRHHENNPAEGIEIHVPKGVPEYFTVEQCIAIMDEASKPENRCMTAYFALCLFGGIRPEEAERMTWKNIKLETGEIELSAAITKTKKQRLFKMSDNLLLWLTACKNTTPLVPAANVKNLRVRVCKELPCPWIQDGMRHTFATFHYATHHTLEELRHIMGNSPAIIERFYKGVIPQAETTKFWHIRPSGQLSVAA